MTVAQITALVAIAARIIEIAVPILADMLKTGSVTAEKQLALQQTVDELREKLNAGDLGDHWRIE